MKTRQLFILLMIATVIILTGTLLKVTHNEGGDEVLTVGLLAQFGVIVYAIIRSWKS